MSAPGYIYQVAGLDVADLRTLIISVVGAGKAFEGDIVSLTECQSFNDTGEGLPALTGDFGHAFGARAEVRWKRADDDDSFDGLVQNVVPGEATADHSEAPMPDEMPSQPIDDGHFDVLVLSEQPLSPPPGRAVPGTWRVRVCGNQRQVLQMGSQAIYAVEYYDQDANQAVTFVRYAEVKQ